MSDESTNINQTAAPVVQGVVIVDPVAEIERLQRIINVLASALRDVHSDCSDARINGLEDGETDSDRYTTIENFALDALSECELPIYE